MVNFKEQYKHPAWQKKRLEALQDASFCCQKCGDSESQLHVHHRQYFKGRKIWEYSIDELEVLCETCHEETHAINDVLKSLLSRIPTCAVEEVLALLSGYISSTEGPIREASPFVDDNIAQLYSLDPYSYAIGSLAGAINSFCADVYSISDADEKLKDSRHSVDDNGNKLGAVSIDLHRSKGVR